MSKTSFGGNTLPTADEKLTALKHLLKEMESVLIAFSGGVDSTFLLQVAYDTLRDNVLAVTAGSATYPQAEFDEACALAAGLGVKHLCITTDELADERFAQNPPERCYYCKQELFSKLRQIAFKNGLLWVLDGANADDTGDFRPGIKAGRELGVRSPLLEAGLTKQEIRELSRRLGLPTWDKPNMACLSSRFPYGHRITPAKLAQIEQAEAFLKARGFREVRVRHHGHIARIEVPSRDIPVLTVSPFREELLQNMKNLGFAYITVDLAGFRSGSMNEVLSEENKSF
ncbi:ATP-dependent sacrificial sulfur transferase LarE [bacterium]|nr:MAG: ATP-dependent sacrificial sulfur transferase LarE [bacterium]